MIGPLAPFKKQNHLEISLLQGIVVCWKPMNGVWLIWVERSLGVRVYGSAAISFAKILSGRLLTYVTYLQPWDYAAASILGGKSRAIGL